MNLSAMHGTWSVAGIRNLYENLTDSNIKVSSMYTCTRTLVSRVRVNSNDDVA